MTLEPSQSMPDRLLLNSDQIVEERALMQSALSSGGGSARRTVQAAVAGVHPLNRENHFTTNLIRNGKFTIADHRITTLHRGGD